jgi:hypothetical protein
MLLCYLYGDQREKDNRTSRFNVGFYGISQLDLLDCKVDTYSNFRSDSWHASVFEPSAHVQKVPI